MRCVVKWVSTWVNPPNASWDSFFWIQGTFAEAWSKVIGCSDLVTSLDWFCRLRISVVKASWGPKYYFVEYVSNSCMYGADTCYYNSTPWTILAPPTNDITWRHHGHPVAKDINAEMRPIKRQGSKFVMYAFKVWSWLSKKNVGGYSSENIP